MTRPQWVRLCKTRFEFWQEMSEDRAYSIAGSTSDDSIESDVASLRSPTAAGNESSGEGRGSWRDIANGSTL